MIFHTPKTLIIELTNKEQVKNLIQEISKQPDNNISVVQNYNEFLISSFSKNSEGEDINKVRKYFHREVWIVELLRLL